VERLPHLLVRAGPDEPCGECLAAGQRPRRRPWLARKPALEALRARWRDAPDDSTQATIAAEMQRQTFQDLPHIPLGQLLQRTAFRRDIQDIPAGFAAFWSVRRG
jgi:peptide/nickel transport system substrate-binding protein